MNGYLLTVLHHHLPFVKHPEYKYFQEEHWLFEAIVESYIPLLQKLFRLTSQGVKPKLTVSLTPPLCEMLADPILNEKFKEFLERSKELAEKEVRRNRGTELEEVSFFYKRRFEEIENFFFQELNGSVLKGYKELQEEGSIEIISSGATHGLLPALQGVEEAVECQIKVAVKNYRKHFEREPKGIWLPECGYYPEVEGFLKKYGIGYFFLDSHGILLGKPLPPFGVYSPVKTPKGLTAFGRDPASSKQVWSSKEGYPGDPVYREFYRDIGFDLPLEYVAPYINPDGSRTYTGFKYYRITGEVPLDKKEIYKPERALDRAREHAEHFLNSREKQCLEVKGKIGREPIIVAPFDAELFGHWWFEGPEFLFNLFTRINDSSIRPAFADEYCQKYTNLPVSQPTTSSWGDRGYFDVWVNGENDWVYFHLYGMALELRRLKKTIEKNPFSTRVLNQMLRELLLAQSSDWTFLITTKTAKEYAVNRLREHISNFNRLKKWLISGRAPEEEIRKIEEKNSIFQEINFWEDWPCP